MGIQACRNHHCECDEKQQRGDGSELLESGSRPSYGKSPKVEGATKVGRPFDTRPGCGFGRHKEGMMAGIPARSEDALERNVDLAASRFLSSREGSDWFEGGLHERLMQMRPLPDGSLPLETIIQIQQNICQKVRQQDTELRRIIGSCSREGTAASRETTALCREQTFYSREPTCSEQLEAREPFM
mmetsp:Transcript_32765/g.71576  ORF Transcript_32765/g.71576 Transcript_32765/m.71576 type:complete len:186 (+) Transcript_32765:132-689(+)